MVDKESYIKDLESKCKSIDIEIEDLIETIASCRDKIRLLEYDKLYIKIDINYFTRMLEDDKC